MHKWLIGINLQETSPAQTLEAIRRADALGVPAVWLNTGEAIPDALTLFAAATASTRTIKFGTAVVPTFPRHPIVTIQQAEVIANLAPGRLVLGIGPSHRPMIEHIHGLPYERPLEHLREYVAVLKAGLHNGRVDFEGSHYRVHATVNYPVAVPVMVSALRARAFGLAGEVADGAIAWACPAPYLRDIALPALQQGAAAVGRPVPPLVAHCFVAVSEDEGEVKRVAFPRLRYYARMAFYAAMLEAAGYSEAERTDRVDALYDALVVHGDESKVAAGLQSFLSTSGATELIATLLPIGTDRPKSNERALRLIAEL